MARRYRTIVADPPWRVKAGPGGMGYNVVNGVQVWNTVSRPSRNLAYPTMSLEDIEGLPVQAVSEDACHLYLFTINKYVEHSYAVARAWGFSPSTLLVWAKNPMGGGLGGAYGISTEFILFARKGSLPATGRQKTTWFNWKRKYSDCGKPVHSAKPEEFFSMVEQMSPPPRLELFARRQRDGWDVWGDEVQSDISLLAPE